MSESLDINVNNSFTPTLIESNESNVNDSFNDLVRYYRVKDLKDLMVLYSEVCSLTLRTEYS